MNGLHPKVQDFMNKLLFEAVNNYNIDGIQGDNSLPAITGEVLYEEVTKNRYAAEPNGVLTLAN